MARLPYPDDSGLPKDLIALRQALPRLNVFDMWSYSAGTIRPVLELGAAQYAALCVPRPRRELVTLAAALAVDCEYEWFQHLAPARAAGVTEDQLDALRRGDFTADCFSEEDQAALTFAAAVLAAPTVSDDIFTSTAAVLEPRQLIELVGLVGYYWMLGRVATVFEVENDVAQGTEIYDAGVKLARGER
ncbi:carboxymuconolactone decarboxylase family protein [Nocardia sp. NPDC052566]|uniref:carboxymuconolactone decarboxylase family protein n=1 Tax=Nocardia sp. NPDC052566 TaxID=3364330 RepID=UPI0037C68FE1